jgi:hypothetical protein
MRKHLKSVLVAALFGATALNAVPDDVLAGPMSVTNPVSVGPSNSIELAHYRGYYRRHYLRHGAYYHRGYGIPGAAAGAAAGIVGAAAGLVGAGIGEISGYGYPGYGGGYGVNTCWVWDPGLGWVWGCR